jgi:protocatechuate 3,4-dioxygenase alpha subunit
MNLVPIPSQTAGPFFHLGLTAHRSIGNLAAAGVPGERIQLTCRVLDGEGVPVDDAMIEIWQADAAGRYNHSDDVRQGNALPAPAGAEFHGFGRLATDDHGMCTFATIKPGRVPGNGNIFQAPHVNVSVFARGILKRLATRAYFAGDPANHEDPVLNLVPLDRRDTLLAHGHAQPNEWHFDIHLCGDSETVFFDI